MSFREYELMFIVRPDAGSEVARERTAFYRDLVEELGGTVHDVDEWGTRRLAYAIDDFEEGYYSILQFTGDEDLTRETDRRLKLDDTVMRFMIVNKEQ
ncbi:MAG: 30S ribosomal protein S6 [Bacillota bacterium]